MGLDSDRHALQTVAPASCAEDSAAPGRAVYGRKVWNMDGTKRPHGVFPSAFTACSRNGSVLRKERNRAPINRPEKYANAMAPHIISGAWRVPLQRPQVSNRPKGPPWNVAELAGAVAWGPSALRADRCKWSR